MSFNLIHEDAFKVLPTFDPCSFQAIVTDPPYGVREYTTTELEKMRNRTGGVWRIPMRIGGYERSLLPRFTVLTEKDIRDLRHFFTDFGTEAFRILVPGAHIILASTPLVSHHVIDSVVSSGFEFRATMVRIVRTLRGGDRPKGAENEFKNVSAMPRGCWEPWLIFRKPLEGTLAENLRKWNTGGLRRFSEETPFLDLVKVEKTPKAERLISDHPSTKPQELMRMLVRSSLPLGKGRILDPFAGCGSTLAAAEYCNIPSIGIEIDEKFYQQALKAIPKLAKIKLKNPIFNSAPYLTPIDDFI